jgi:hypothetical protein
MGGDVSDQKSNRNQPEHFGSVTAQGSSNMEILFLLAFIAAWFALQMWILPRFGVST